MTPLLSLHFVPEGKTYNMLTVADKVDHPPSRHHRSQTWIQFSHSDKFLSKESEPIGNTRNPSFRVYYNDSISSVPFNWETTPGTPKHALFGDDDSHVVIPPLTPPPRFFSNGGSGSRSGRSGSRKLLEGFFMRWRIKSAIAHVSPLRYLPSSPSSNSVSSESSSDVDRKAPTNWRRSLSNVRLLRRIGLLSKATSFRRCFSS